MQHASAEHAAHESAGQLSLRYFWDVFVRNRKLVLGTLAAVLALAVLYLTQARPSYLSQASVRVEDERNKGSLLGELSPLAGGGKSAIATEILVLRTYQLAAEVADTLDLHVVVREPAVDRAQVLGAVSAPRNAVPGVYVLERQENGAYSVRIDKGARGVQVPRTVQVAQPFALGGARVALSARLRGAGAPERIVLEVRRFRRTVEDMRDRLGISRPHPEAQVVSIEYQDTDRQLAAAVPNSLTQRFIEYKKRSEKSESQSTVRFLRDQVANYESQLAGAETALRDFREGAQVVSPKDQATEAVKRLAELEATRDQLQTARSSLAQLLQRAEVAPTDPSQPSPYRQLAAFPTFLENQAVQDLLRALIDQENVRSELLMRRTPENPDVQARTQRIQELELQLYQMARNYLQTIDSQLDGVNANLARFGVQMQAVPATEIALARLSRQTELLEDIYTLLQTRLKEAEIKEAAENDNIRLIDQALLPDKPFAPRPFRTLVLALMFGAVAGMGLAMARETLDTKVRTRQDVQNATSGMPVLGFIPPIKVPALANGNGRRNGKGAHAPEEIMGQRLVARTAPQSAVAEAYRALRTSLTFSSFETPPRVLVVASAMPGDGKSTTASNLAITLAQQGTRTLLVDADLRKGLLHHVLSMKREPGLTNVLLGASTLEQAVQQVEVGGAHTLSFLASGPYPPNPAEALGSDRMRVLLEEMRAQYDIVIFDAPPLNLVTDAAVLGKQADATILIARAGATDKGALHHAASQLQHLRASVLGVVLNNFDLAGSGYYGYGRHEYHSN